MADERAWLEAKEKFPLRSLVNGKVVRTEPFGVFVEIPGCGVHAVLLVTEFVGDQRGEVHAPLYLGAALASLLR